VSINILQYLVSLEFEYFKNYLMDWYEKSNIKRLLLSQ